jgi:hypothetical protein
LDGEIVDLLQSKSVARHLSTVDPRQTKAKNADAMRGFNTDKQGRIIVPADEESNDSLTQSDDSASDNGVKKPAAKRIVLGKRKRSMCAPIARLIGHFFR